MEIRWDCVANLWDEFPGTSRDSCGSEIVGTLRLWKLSFEEASVFVLFDQVTDASTAWGACLGRRE